MKFRFCGDLDCPDWVLAEINTLSNMSSIRLKVLVSQILSNCINGELNYDKVRKLASENPNGTADIKGGIAAIHFIITSAAKYDVDDKVLIQEIQQLGLPKENSDQVAKQYRENKDTLRQALEDKSYRISHFISADWRVDQVLAFSNNKNNNNEPIDTNNFQLTTEKIVHLNLKYNVNDILQEDNATNLKNIQNIALELTADNLDLLIHELSQAEKLMDDVSS